MLTYFLRIQGRALQAFPEALFHHLLRAMVHPDHETRVGAHRIFSVVLVPSSVCPHPSSDSPESPKTYDLERTLSRTTSVFSSSAALFQKLRRDKSSLSESASGQDGLPNPQFDKLQSSKSRFFSFKQLHSSKSRINSISGAPLAPIEETSSLNQEELVCV